MISVDTGAWFARFVPSDPYHDRVKAWFDANDQRLVTSDYCVDETLTLLLVRGHHRRLLHAGTVLFDESVAALHFLTPQQIQRAWILFRQRMMSGWSFTDCTSKIVIDDLGITAAVALDDHFRQFGVATIP